MLLSYLRCGWRPVRALVSMPHCQIVRQKNLSGDLHLGDGLSVGPPAEFESGGNEIDGAQHHRIGVRGVGR